MECESGVCGDEALGIECEGGVYGVHEGWRVCGVEDVSGVCGDEALGMECEGGGGYGGGM